MWSGEQRNASNKLQVALPSIPGVRFLIVKDCEVETSANKHCGGARMQGMWIVHHWQGNVKVKFSSCSNFHKWHVQQIWTHGNLSVTNKQCEWFTRRRKLNALNFYLTKICAPIISIFIVRAFLFSYICKLIHTTLTASEEHFMSDPLVQVMK